VKQGRDAPAFHPALEPAHGGSFAKNTRAVGEPFVFDPELPQRLFQNSTEIRGFDENYAV